MPISENNPWKDTFNEGTNEVSSTESDGFTDNLVSQSQELANKVDSVLNKVAEAGRLKSFFGAVDVKKAAIGYISAMVASVGLEKTANALNIPAVDLEALGPFIKYITEGRSIVSQTPAVVPIAIGIWAVKTWGNTVVNNVFAEAEKFKSKDALRDLKNQPKNWTKVGAALSTKGYPKLGQVVGRYGGIIGATITAFIYRSQLYGAGKALFDRHKPRQQDVTQELDAQLHNYGDPKNPTQLYINEQTGEVSKTPRQGFIALNKGGKVKKPYIKRKGIMRY